MTTDSPGASLTPEQREGLIKALETFDPSDEYHGGDGLFRDDVPSASRPYYAAIDRAVRLIKGDIANWQSPRPRVAPPLEVYDDKDDEEFCPTCLAGTESSEHLTKPCGENDR